MSGWWLTASDGNGYLTETRPPYYGNNYVEAHLIFPGVTPRMSVPVTLDGAHVVSYRPEEKVASLRCSEARLDDGPPSR